MLNRSFCYKTWQHQYNNVHMSKNSSFSQIGSPITIIFISGQVSADPTQTLINKSEIRGNWWFGASLDWVLAETMKIVGCCCSMVNTYELGVITLKVKRQPTAFDLMSHRSIIHAGLLKGACTKVKFMQWTHSLFWRTLRHSTPTLL